MSFANMASGYQFSIWHKQLAELDASLLRRIIRIPEEILYCGLVGTVFDRFWPYHTSFAVGGHCVLGISSGSLKRGPIILSRRSCRLLCALAFMGEGFRILGYPHYIYLRVTDITWEGFGNSTIGFQLGRNLGLKESNSTVIRLQTFSR